MFDDCADLGSWRAPLIYGFSLKWKQLVKLERKRCLIVRGQMPLEESTKARNQGDGQADYMWKEETDIHGGYRDHH